MNLKKLFIGTVVGTIVQFLLGWLVYGYLLRHFMWHHSGAIGHVDRREIDFLFLVTGHIAEALLLTYIILKGSTSSLLSGLTTGAITGLLMGISFDAIQYATTLVLSKRAMGADILAFTLICAVTGAIIGAMVAGKDNQ